MGRGRPVNGYIASMARISGFSSGRDAGTSQDLTERLHRAGGSHRRLVDLPAAGTQPGLGAGDHSRGVSDATRWNRLRYSAGVIPTWRWNARRKTFTLANPQRTATCLGT